MKKIIAILLLGVLFATQSHAQTVNTAKLDSFFNALAANDKTMGSFAVAKDGRVVYQRSVGYQVLGPDSVKATANTQYRIGSITKVFTAVMIFQLIDEGKLSLDTKLSKFYPALPNSDKITIDHLLSHTSGLIDYVSEVSNRVWITQAHPKNELLDTIAKRKVNFEPGSKQQYSNSGYLLLSYILEDITGKSFNKLLETRIVKKLGLKSSVAGVPNNSKNEAMPYARISSWTDIKDIYFPNVIGVGDILSTPADLLVFMNALASGKLLSAERYADMRTFTGQSRLARGLMKVPFYEYWGLGHGGDTYGTHSILYHFKESGISIAFCVNGLNYPINDISIALLSAAYNKPLQIPSFKSLDLTPAELDPLTGTYSSAGLPFTITVTRNGSSIIAQASGQSALPMEAVTKSRFKFDGAGIVLEFDTQKKEMLLKQHGHSFVFSKQ
ncbi:serine hydrolase domain-containing protein [Pedobacter deserti]|uniref:serine hydrolase domain-containing protein n=1 Tax=Pedobacter deserti TaxID=2817382 RepID=UPI00210A8FF5|nr:serine hydrolase domain-containing protein [Pedobacter sp. SYSU D00382]